MAIWRLGNGHGTEGWEAAMQKNLDLFFLMITFGPVMTMMIKNTKQTKKQFPQREGV